MRAYRVGLTGGLASGKSTVAGWLRDAGFEVVDADRLVAELYRPRAAGAAAARDLFGINMLTPEGGVDHAALGARVFSDPEARRALEQAIHPLVRQRFEEIANSLEPPRPLLALRSPARPAPLEPLAPPDAGPRPPAEGAAPPASPPVIVLEATLLVEAGYGPGFDLIVAIEADPELRLGRAVARGLDEASARARLAAQGDGAIRRQGAHRVIDNSSGLPALRLRVDALIADIRKAAAAAATAGEPPQATPPLPPATPSRR